MRGHLSAAVRAHSGAQPISVRIGALLILLLAAMRPAVASQVDPTFFKDCAFVSVDLQQTDCAHLPAEPLDDFHAGLKYLGEVGLPNAVRVVNACRACHFPIIFLHWGFRDDGLDLDPADRLYLTQRMGSDTKRWPGKDSDPHSAVAAPLAARAGEFVLTKTSQDAFASCRIGFILQNLNVKNLILVGGHTEGCLRRTADGARLRGYRTLCVEDATWNLLESKRKASIQQTGFTYVLTTTELLTLLGQPLQADDVGSPGHLLHYALLIALIAMLWKPLQHFLKPS